MGDIDILKTRCRELAAERDEQRARADGLAVELATLRAVPGSDGAAVCIDDDCPFPEHVGDCPPASPEQWEHLARLRARHIAHCHKRTETARAERASMADAVKEQRARAEAAEADVKIAEADARHFRDAAEAATARCAGLERVVEALPKCQERDCGRFAVWIYGDTHSPIYCEEHHRPLLHSALRRADWADALAALASPVANPRVPAITVRELWPGQWRLFVGDFGVADWPSGKCAEEDPKHYAEEVARCIREALGTPPLADPRVEAAEALYAALPRCAECSAIAAWIYPNLDGGRCGAHVPTSRGYVSPGWAEVPYTREAVAYEAARGGEGARRG